MNSISQQVFPDIRNRLIQPNKSEFKSYFHGNSIILWTALQYQLLLQCHTTHQPHNNPQSFPESSLSCLNIVPFSATLIIFAVIPDPLQFAVQLYRSVLFSLLCHEIIIIHSLPETRSRHLQCLFHPAYQFRNKVETMFAMFPFHRCHRHPLYSSYCPTYTPTQSLTHSRYPTSSLAQGFMFLVTRISSVAVVRTVH